MRGDNELRRAVDSPRFVLWGALASVMAIAWTYLLLAAAVPGPVERGTDDGWTAMLTALCRVEPAASLTGFAASVVIWAAMAFAMMMPAAMPMVTSYLDIEDAARAKGMNVASPFVLLAGYIAVWLGFSVAAAALQTALAAAALLTPDAQLAAPQLAGSVLVLAGIYQFTALKAACLTQCRRPMTVFMAAWRDDAAGVFRLGVRQGAFCVGCCWALMLAMLAVGVMNLSWMAVLAAIMVMEKTLGEPRPLTWGIGASLVVIGAAAISL